MAMQITARVRDGSILSYYIKKQLNLQIVTLHTTKMAMQMAARVRDEMPSRQPMDVFFLAARPSIWARPGSTPIHRAPREYKEDVIIRKQLAT